MGAQLYRGPNGVVFAPAEAVHEETITQKVEAGEWVPVEDADEKSKPAPKRAARSTK